MRFSMCWDVFCMTSILYANSILISAKFPIRLPRKLVTASSVPNSLKICAREPKIWKFGNIEMFDLFTIFFDQQWWFVGHENGDDWVMNTSEIRVQSWFPIDLAYQVCSKSFKNPRKLTCSAKMSKPQSQSEWWMDYTGPWCVVGRKLLVTVGLLSLLSLLSLLLSRAAFGGGGVFLKLNMMDVAIRWTFVAPVTL